MGFDRDGNSCSIFYWDFYTFIIRKNQGSDYAGLLCIVRICNLVYSYMVEQEAGHRWRTTKMILEMCGYDIRIAAGAEK